LATSASMAEAARIALALIRAINGAIALFAPRLLIRAIGLDPAGNPAGLYIARLFGIRTLVIAADLVQADRSSRGRAIEEAVIIHASDAIAATMAGLERRVPPRGALMAATISSVNTALALIALAGRNGPQG
jgi:hypothetical protein